MNEPTEATVKKFVRFAISEYRDQALNGDSTLCSTALIRKCLELARKDVSGCLSDLACEQAESFNTREKHDIDYAHWSAVDYWTVDQVACLASGYDPSDIDLIDTSDYVNFELFVKMRRLAELHLFYIGNNSPIRLYRHLTEGGAKFPKELGRLIRKKENFFTRHETNLRRLKETQIKNGKHFNSIMTIIYATGVHRYGYVKGKRTDAAAMLSSEISRAGLTLDVGPVRKILNAADSWHKRRIRKNTHK
ncbi:MAG: hypothetical protein J0I31_02780 [Rhizobiales bacterium]|nr:hypothetical protein [Hyphomicrobiales bacterium]